MRKFNEDTRVKIPATLHFMKLGYSYQSLKDADVDFDTKILVNRFKPAIEKINRRDYSNIEIESLLREIHELIRNNDLRYGSTLFSEPEQAYLNYQLNQAEFSNGLDLRNKYIHSSYSRDPRIQEEDYDRLLRIMALVVMKVNEEFCLRDLRDQE